MITEAFTTSETTAKLDAALAKAQGEIGNAAKDKVNPFFKSKYADLASVWAACRTSLSKNQIAVTQWPLHSEDGRIHMVTRLAHDGEWIRAHFSIPIQKQDAQGYASGLTYVKRLTLSAAVGVVADEDDDGNASVGDAKAAKPASSASLKRSGIWEKMLGEIEACKNEGQLIQWQDDNIAEVNKLPETWREQVLNQLELRAEELRPKNGHAKQTPAEWAKSAMTTISKLTDASFIDQWEMQNEKLIAALRDKSRPDWELLVKALADRRAMLHPVNAI